MMLSLHSALIVSKIPVDNANFSTFVYTECNIQNLNIVRVVLEEQPIVCIPGTSRFVLMLVMCVVRACVICYVTL